MIGNRTMSDSYTYFDNLDDQSQIPSDSILSRTLVDNAHLKLILFRFAAGQELSEHTASLPAIIQILTGEATVTLGGDSKEAKAGAWVFMPAQLKHSIYAKTPLIMLLQMLKQK